MRMPLITLLPLAAISAAAGAEAWTAVATLPRAVAGHAAAVHEGVLWSVGGSFWAEGVKRVGHSVARRPLHQAASAPWEMVTTVPGGYAHGGYAADDGDMWLAGGLSEAGPSAAVRKIELGTGAVHAFAELAEARVYCGAAVLDGALWVLGGARAEDQLSRASGVSWRVELSSGVVTVAPEGPAWINPLVLPLGDELHVLPGGEWSSAQQRLVAPECVWVYSPRVGKWQRRPLPARLPRGLSGVTLDRERALIVGGVAASDEGARIGAGAWIYSRPGSLQPVGALPQPRLAAAVATDGQSVFVLGGEDRPRGRADTIWEGKGTVR